ncbi:hypothetical protein NEMBOFW57_010523 [Staphylotrichum longicolle]|uniref:Peptidase S54 rhomboid domain-containing protein n=1 Tax=Staphylotrichum longicolle TaxID=669026 RepID=A0AAD4HUD2_9PEZI|nr:hypothetical protein NEMBOFW57_010523 [Staphylotrichum longicolle]
MPNPTHMIKLTLQRTVVYIDRLPLFTRLVIVLAVACEILAVLPWWDVRAAGRLEPDLIGLSTMHRTNTYPFIHMDVIHLIINLLGVTPMLERFEAENGTLTSIALFFGPIRHHKTSPYVIISGRPTIPTWSAPIVMVLLAAILLPGSSALGHLCGLAIGYIFGLGYIKFLAPPEWALRWIEGKFKLRSWLPYYVSVDQKVYGRFGAVLPMSNLGSAPVVAPGLVGSNQRLGPAPE